LTGTHPLPSLPTMPTPSRARAILLALLLLAPSLLCAADPAERSAPRGARRIGSTEGIHCFCHSASQPGAASMSRPDAPAARTLYATVAAFVPDRGSVSMIAVVREIPAAGLVSPKPPTPPPNALA
jgi:hypothetical protein